MQSFSYASAAQHVVFGPDAAMRLGELAGGVGWRRLLLVTTPHLRENGSIEIVANALGDSLIGVFEEVEPHVPDYQVELVVGVADEHEVDAVIGLGGGSPIGMAKAVCLALEARRSRAASARAATLLDPPEVPGIAIPTTYAGSEMTPVYGVTHVEPDGSTRKITVRDSKVTPKLVVYDPVLTLSLGRKLTASSGINALAHCIEAVYSRTRNPLATGAALQGIRHISGSLVRCYENGRDLAARTEMLVGAHLGGAALATVEMGLHHGAGHVLGGTAGVPHGVANCIVLPHAVRYNASTVAPQLALAAEVMGLRRNGRSEESLALAVADHLDELIGRLDQPRRLRDAGVPRELLPRLAANLLKSNAVRSNPKPLAGADEAFAFLEAMW